MTLNQTDLDLIKQIIQEKLAIKSNHLPTKNKFYKKMDEVIEELKTIRSEQTLIAGRLSNHEAGSPNWMKIRPLVDT